VVGATVVVAATVVEDAKLTYSQGQAAGTSTQPVAAPAFLFPQPKPVTRIAGPALATIPRLALVETESREIPPENSIDWGFLLAEDEFLEAVILRSRRP